MITLYQFPTSPFCEKVRRMLSYKKLAYALVDVPRAQVQDYRLVSPIGKFPAIDCDGASAYDSTDIAEFLDSLVQGSRLIPQDPQARALAHVIEDWADESLYFYEIEMRLAWRHNLPKALPAFAATMPGLSEADVFERIATGAKQLTTAQGLGRKPSDRVIRDAERHFAAIDGLLGGRDWLVGDALSVADLAVACQVNALRYAEECEAMIERLPDVLAWLARVDDAAPDAPASTPI